MKKNEYANAYKEVLVILGFLIEEDYNKIPKEYINFFIANCNNNHKFNYDFSKTFQEQELLDETKYILFGLFEKFGTTELQRKKINAFKNNYYNKLEENKRRDYGEIFYKRNNFVKQDISVNKNVVCNKNNKGFILKKIYHKIKGIFSIDID